MHVAAEREDALKDLAEFQLAATLYNAMLENNCSEHASRMSAMENSTKSAGEMLTKLTLKYNRDRQANITTSLVEIISGAAALVDE
ncbi:F-type H+-transporting ATPase subunit gamma [Monoraphidium neglectum]|uniref:F-type H+-transporting ATPase subunit gamma n=1 Tax=Monoraphidium neglectum TaxID=145388 RepID=A0A0D2LXU3_9CHLO|nr:F-type H+-transporting ATPase subunit gamma [Monoraphidium neglectum]KIY94326.1 F-type H+-transporting ATPase subunit gamma [Monoraphidium neglectum]|eukprot:XP_013893346.1 F-type H+-transporting ATPase subunit gamma [Monoraphidium neglectum]